MFRRRREAALAVSKSAGFIDNSSMAVSDENKTLTFKTPPYVRGMDDGTITFNGEHLKGYVPADTEVAWTQENRYGHVYGSFESYRKHLKAEHLKAKEVAAAKAKVEAELLAKDLRMYNLGAPPLEKGDHYRFRLMFEDGQWLPYLRVGDPGSQITTFGQNDKWFRAKSQATEDIISAAWEAWEYAYPKDSLPAATSELLYGP